jgi:hypothetical protein
MATTQTLHAQECSKSIEGEALITNKIQSNVLLLPILSILVMTT